MLVGLDVCHKGKESIIGFVASYDEHMCKYYTQANPQKQKGKEIIDADKLYEYFTNAFAAYKDYNKGALPDHVFIFRDGVGDSMRDMVLDKELPTLKKIIAENYESGEAPHITLIVVNKRVRQRFFHMREG